MCAEVMLPTQQSRRRVQGQGWVLSGTGCAGTVSGGERRQVRGELSQVQGRSILGRAQDSCGGELMQVSKQPRQEREGTPRVL